MIVDGTSLPDGHTIDTDIAVIGGGVAGIALASQLTHKGIGVALLESGSQEQDPHSMALNEGEVTGMAYFPLTETRVRCLGGASNHWGGYCAPLDPEDFAPQEWISLSGWPFQRQELDYYYHLAHQFLRLPCDGYSAHKWKNRIGLPTLDLDNGNVVTNMVHSCGRFNVGAQHKSMLHSSTNVTTYLNTTALRLCLPSDHRTVVSADVASSLGTRMKLRAKHFVLAGGGIENPRLLMLSGLGHNAVGKFFMEHPCVRVGGIMDAPEDLDLRFYQEAIYDDRHHGRGCLVGSLQLSPEERAQERLSNAKLFVEWSQDTECKPRSVDLTAQWEQEPAWNSYISLADTQDCFGRPLPLLHWELSSQDWWTVNRSAEIFADALRQLRIGRVELTPIGPSCAILGAHHHLGTTRMSLSPSTGVVDPYCRVHGVDNLFVASGSVFPTVGQAPPTLTIIALAFRLANHLLDLS